MTIPKIRFLMFYLFVTVGIFNNVSPARSLSADPVYTAVIDAGSSGTRLYFYKVVPGPYPQITMEIDKVENKVQPNNYAEDGINNFVCSKAPGYSPPNEVVPQVIAPLLDTLAAKASTLSVPTNQVAVNVLATAGMRVALDQCGQAAVTQLYTYIKQGIVAKGFMVGEVRTTDGNSEEGVWTWTNLNDQYYHVFTTSTAPVGDVEVGGSSTQISYPTALSPNSSQNIYTVKLNGKIFSVFNRTYLGLGQDDARKFVRKLAQPPLGHPQFVHPQDCWATGFPAANDAGEDDPAYPKLKVNGSYNFTVCGSYDSGYIANIIARYGDPHVANSSGPFVGIDGAWWATKYWNIQDTPSQLQDSLGACLNYQNFPNILTNKSTQFQCANATYIDTLLYGSVNGLFKRDPTKFSKALPNDDAVTKASVLTWTRGYVLLKYSN